MTREDEWPTDVTVDEACTHLSALRDVAGFKNLAWGFPGGAVVESLPANAGDTGASPGLGRSHMPRSN